MPAPGSRGRGPMPIIASPQSTPFWNRQETSIATARVKRARSPSAGRRGEWGVTLSESNSQTPPSGKGYSVSRKKRRQGNAAEAPAVPEPAPAAGPELLRRYLLGLLTALIVARPFVLGEDPGILLALTDTSNLVLTLLWIVAAVGWASWRAWSGRGAWYGGFVEAGLLAAVVLVFVGAASVARYKYPAQLIGC